MITITIGNKKYKGVYLWKDITLAKYIELASIMIPEGYEALVMADGNFSPEKVEEYVDKVSAITDEQIKEFSKYYRKVINCLTNIPESLPLAEEQVTDIYEYFLKPFVISLIYQTPMIFLWGQLKQYEPERIKSFWIKGRRYYLPESVNIMGEIIPLAKEDILTYSEAADLIRGAKLNGEDLNRLALFMAVYCRRKGEQYDEKKVLERREAFLNLPMSTVWAVFFYTHRQLRGYTMTTVLYGSLPKTTRETVYKARQYRSTEAGPSSTRLQGTELTEA